MRGLLSILTIFCNELINLIIQEHECLIIYISYDIKVTFKYHFLRKNVNILSLCTQRCYGRHNVSRKSVNH